MGRAENAGAWRRLAGNCRDERYRCRPCHLSFAQDHDVSACMQRMTCKVVASSLHSKIGDIHMHRDHVNGRLDHVSAKFRGPKNQILNLSP